MQEVAMKNRVPFLTLICFWGIMIPSRIQAQDPDTLWTLKLPGGAQQKGFSYVIPTQDNNYLAAGLSSTDSTLEDIWIVKFAKNGEILWNRTYITDTNNAWINENIRGITETDNGDILVFVSNTQWEQYILVLDSGGIITKLLKTMDSDDPYYVYCGINTSDGGYIIAGEHSVANGNNWLHYSWYRKIDSEGNTIWEHDFPPLTVQDRFMCMNKTPGGDFILAGTSNAFNSDQDLLLAKINQQGDTTWLKRWGTSSYDNPYEITPASDGGFIAACTKSAISSHKGYLLKINKDGNVEWHEMYNDYDDDQLFSVKQTTDNGYIATGSYTPYGANRPRFWILKTDNMGKQIKSFHFGDEIKVYSGKSVIQVEDGSYFAVGSCGDDGLIVKVSPNFGSLGLDEDIRINNNLLHLEQNYPNPFSSSTLISWQSKEPGHVQLVVYDFIGRKIQTLADTKMPAVKHQITFDASGLPAGVYFYQLRFGNYIEIKKMILTK